MVPLKVPISQSNRLDFRDEGGNPLVNERPDGFLEEDMSHDGFVQYQVLNITEELELHKDPYAHLDEDDDSVVDYHM